MIRIRRRWWLVAAGAAALVVAVALVPFAFRAFWSMRGSNPVRRGVQLARELGCFHCHGPAGAQGIPDPTATIGEVPAWSGGTWMMYVESDEQIRQFILDGMSRSRAESAAAARERELATVRMPAYRGYVDEREVEDLVAVFKVLSRMALPSPGSPERRGLELAERWSCFSCHGPAASGGLPNPGSFVGFIPGWYGADFEDLVRNREEFVVWIREGTIPRLRDGLVGAWFLRRQRIDMPAYPELTDEELDALWAYAVWLAGTDGGHRGTEHRR